jgi:hypothetical protein
MSDLERMTAELIASRNLGETDQKYLKIQNRTQSVSDIFVADKVCHFVLVSVSTTCDALLSNRTPDLFFWSTSW